MLLTKLNDSGFVLVTVIVYTIVLIILGTSLMTVTLNEYRIEKAYRESLMANYLAEAGMEKAIYKLAELENIYPGIVSKTWKMEDDDRDLLKSGIRADYTVSVENVQLEDTIYADEERTMVYKRIYSVILKSNASVEGMNREIEAQIKVEDYEAQGKDNKVQIMYWRQKK